MAPAFRSETRESMVAEDATSLSRDRVARYKDRTSKAIDIS